MDHRNIHGGDIYRSQIALDFSVNVNPLGAPPEVLRDIKENVSKIESYPDVECETLKKYLSEYEQVPYEWVICGNGAAELFYASVLALKPKKALLCTPGFAEYERCLSMVKAKITYYECRKEHEFRIQPDILDALDPKLNMIFLCNPNNPTGQMIDEDLLEQIIEKCKEQKITIVMDECFIDFVDQANEYSVKKKVETYDHIILVKTLTKIFAMPGLRVGYVICSNLKLLEKMKNVMQPWNVSVLAQIGAVSALRHHKKNLSGLHDLIRNERYYLSWSLKQLGYEVFESKVNYILFHDPNEALEEDLYEEALKDGILIRDCSNFKGLQKGYYRIAVRGEREDRIFIQWLKNKKEKS